MEEEAKTVMDSLAVGGTVATLAGWLPSVASLFTIIWLSLRTGRQEMFGLPVSCYTVPQSDSVS